MMNMKKIVRVILAFSLIGIFVGIGSVRGAYQVDIGDIYTYDIVESEISFIYGAISGSGGGYQVSDGHFQSGTSVTVEITDVDVDYVSVEIAGGTKTEDVTVSSSMYDMMSYIALYLVWVQDEIDSIDPSDAEHGVGLMDFWVADTDYVEAGLGFFTSGSFTSSISEIPNFTANEQGAKVETSGSSIIFDWILSGSIVDAGTNTDYSGTALYKIAFDTTTGVLQGYHFIIGMDGLWEGKMFTIHLSQKVEKAGCNLPDFVFGNKTGFISEHGWQITFVAITGLSLIILIFIRRKKKQ